MMRENIKRGTISLFRFDSLALCRKQVSNAHVEPGHRLITHIELFIRERLCLTQKDKSAIRAAIYLHNPRSDNGCANVFRSIYGHPFQHLFSLLIISVFDHQLSGQTNSRWVGHIQLARLF